MCKTVPYIQGVSVAASVYSLIAVSLDRWVENMNINDERKSMMIHKFLLFPVNLYTIIKICFYRGKCKVRVFYSIAFLTWKRKWEK